MCFAHPARLYCTTCGMQFASDWNHIKHCLEFKLKGSCVVGIMHKTSWYDYYQGQCNPCIKREEELKTVMKKKEEEEMKATMEPEIDKTEVKTKMKKGARETQNPKRNVKNSGGRARKVVVLEDGK